MNNNGIIHALFWLYTILKDNHMIAKILFLLTLLLTPTAFAANQFNDIQSHEYKDAIQHLQRTWVVKWYPDWWYGPDRPVTRAELTKIILEASIDDWVLVDTSLPVYTKADLSPAEKIWNKSDCFDDVWKEWYARYVCYAYSQWIIKWYNNWTFGPDDSVTFAQAFKITLNSFDQWVLEWQWDEWFNWYVNYVESLWVFSDVDPYKTISRWEMAALVHPFMIGTRRWKKEQQKKEVVLEKEVDNQDQQTEKIIILADVSPQEQVIFNDQESSTPRWPANGCNEKKPAAAPTKVMVSWVNRSVITTVWNSYKEWEKIPLIIAFHWRTNSNAQVKWYYGIDRATRGDAIIVYPLWLPEAGPSRSRKSDFSFFDTIVKEYSEMYCIDQDRIYVMGHSLGAAHTNSLACARWDVIRATGSVGWWTIQNECTGPVAALIMHNPDDRLASFKSWEIARDQLVRQNECWPETKSVWPSRWNCVEYTNCWLWEPVVWCPHSDSTAWNWSYYPHTRPDTAGSMIWEFFEEHD